MIAYLLIAFSLHGPALKFKALFVRASISAQRGKTASMVEKLIPWSYVSRLFAILEPSCDLLEV